MAKVMVPLRPCLPTSNSPIQIQTFYCVLLTNPPPHKPCPNQSPDL